MRKIKFTDAKIFAQCHIANKKSQVSNQVSVVLSTDLAALKAQ
jgi:hypothetical protein